MTQANRAAKQGPLIPNTRSPPHLESIPRFSRNIKKSDRAKQSGRPSACARPVSCSYGVVPVVGAAVPRFGSPLTRSGLEASCAACARAGRTAAPTTVRARAEDGKLPLRFSGAALRALVGLVAVVDRVQLVKLSPALLAFVLEDGHRLSCCLWSLCLNLRRSSQYSGLTLRIDSTDIGCASHRFGFALSGAPEQPPPRDARVVPLELQELPFVGEEALDLSIRVGPEQHTGPTAGRVVMRPVLQEFAL